MEARPSVSFTRSFPGISAGLYSECMVLDPRASLGGGVGVNHEAFAAVWDTGSTGCMVSRRVVDSCKLQETASGPISHVTGTTERIPRYVIDLYLPDGLVIRELFVALGDFDDCDVLIGMDVITLGDLAVTNAGGQTVFTFRVPSQGGIDFTLG